MTLDFPFAIDRARTSMNDPLRLSSFVAGTALTLVFGTVLGSHDLFAGSGLIAVMFAINLVVLVRFYWRPTNAVALLFSKLAIQFMTILSASLAALGIVLALGDFAIVRGIHPTAIIVATGLMGLWSVGCGMIAHRDWVSLDPAGQSNDYRQA